MEQILEDGLVGEVVVIEESELGEQNLGLVMMGKSKINTHEVNEILLGLYEIAFAALNLSQVKQEGGYSLFVVVVGADDLDDCAETNFDQLQWRDIFRH